MIRVGRTRFKKLEVQSYRQHYQEGTELFPEESWVEITFNSGAKDKIIPTDELHSDQILKQLDKLFGVK